MYTSIVGHGTARQEQTYWHQIDTETALQTHLSKAHQRQTDRNSPDKQNINITACNDPCIGTDRPWHSKTD